MCVCSITSGGQRRPRKNDIQVENLKKRRSGMYIIWDKIVLRTESNNCKNTQMGVSLVFSKNKDSHSIWSKEAKEKCSGGHSQRGIVGPELTMAKTLPYIKSWRGTF